MDSLLLSPERYILVGHKKFKGESITSILSENPIIDFDENDEMTLNFLKKNKLEKHFNSQRHFVNNTDALCALVCEGFGVSVLSEEFARDLISRGKLIDLLPGKFYDYKVALAWYPRVFPSNSFSRVIEVISKKN